MNSAIPSDAPQPRHCHVKKWSNFNGYGFNLHAEKNKHGHHIGALDAGSPAEAAGLKEGDRIVEVNGTNIANENHQQVVSRIRAVANEVKLLVVDTATDEYYKEKRIVVRGDMTEVVTITTPPTMEAYQANPRAGYEEGGSAATTGDPDPAPRLAKLRTWPDFQGYGFNLTSEKSKPGQFIGKVDADSPAATADVREADRIIEVNGVNVTEETHHQVVSRIKARTGQVDLLLVDKATDSFYTSRGSVVRGDMPQVVVKETPERGNEAEEVAAAMLAITDAVDEEEEANEEPVRKKSVVEELPAITVMHEETPLAEPEVQALASAPEPEYDVASPAEEATAASLLAAATDSNTSVGDDAPSPRLCYIKKWLTFTGYGFNLQAGGVTHEHFIGFVDPASPAEAGGLRREDRIFEVNGLSIGKDTHKDVVEKIKANFNEVQLLVADKLTMDYYKDRGIQIHGGMAQVEQIVCPDEAPSVEGVVKAEPEGPSPRLCHLKRWTDFKGYGFNLNAEKGRVGNFIGAVDANSPAHATGILMGDNIIEVNGDDVENVSHGQVVGKITANKDRVTMLLADAETVAFYKAKGVKITSKMPAVKVITCPDSNTAAAPKAAVTNGVPDAKADSKPVDPEPERSVLPPATEPLGGSLQDVLNRVKSRKKPQARTGTLSMQEKFELFQQL